MSIALAELASDTPIAEVAQRFGTSGYVVESVPLALYVLTSKQQGVLAILEQLIAADGDNDTNAAITGQIAGAWLSIDAIPQPDSAIRQRGHLGNDSDFRRLGNGKVDPASASRECPVDLYPLDHRKRSIPMTRTICHGYHTAASRCRWSYPRAPTYGRNTLNPSTATMRAHSQR